MSKTKILNICQLIVLLLGTVVKLASCGSVLFYIPFCSKSVKITFMPLAEEMASKGHEVVVVMPYATKKPNPKVKEIIIDSKEWDGMQAKMSEEKLQTGADSKPPLFELVNVATMVGIFADILVKLIRTRF